jgi:dTDP-4-dehydrorhamnose reductase
LRQAIRDVCPTLIVNASGLTDIDLCEARPDEAQLVNATAPMLLAEEAARLNVPIVHYCSAYVYGGGGKDAWCETDPVRPACQYAHTKALGSEAILSSDVPHLVLRTNWLYSHNRPNIVQSMIDDAQKKEAIHAGGEQIGTPTPARWLASITAKLLSQAGDRLAAWMDFNGGLLHATPQGYASRVEIAEQLMVACREHGVAIVARSVRGPRPKVTGDAGLLPANCRLDCSRLRQLGIELPRWEVFLGQYIRSISDAQNLRARAAA